MAFGAVRCYNTMSAPPPPHVPPPPPIGSSHPPGPPPTSAGPPLPKAGAKKKWAAVVAEQTLSKWSVDPLWKFDPTLSSIGILLLYTYFYISVYLMKYLPLSILTIQL